MSRDVYDPVQSLPHAEEHERSIVQQAISMTGDDKSFLDQVSPADFYDPMLGEIWRWARQVYEDGKPVSPRTIAVKAEAADSHPLVRRMAAIRANPVHEYPTASSVRQIADTARLRRLIGTLHAAAEDAQTAGSYASAFATVQAAVSELEGDHTPQGVVAWDDAVAEWRKRYESDDDQHRIIATPWDALNWQCAGGLHTGRTYVVGARPGSGKSVMGANLAQHAAQTGHSAVVFSVEMGVHEVTSRMLASGARADYGQITKRQIDDRNYRAIDDYITDTTGMTLYLDDKADLTMSHVRATCRSMKRTHGLDVVFVDYLQLLRPEDSRVPREQQVAQISRQLKVLARELDCAVIIACQLNRQSKNDGRKPRLSDLRESGAIEQDADVVILLDRDDEADGPRAGSVDVVVAKNRTGALGDFQLGFAGHQAAMR